MGKKKLGTGFAIFKTYEGVDNLVDFFEYKLRRMVADYYDEGDDENGELLEDLRIQYVTNKVCVEFREGHPWYNFLEAVEVPNEE
jgi:hypothetical protein